jgi:hypothetical protein
MTKHTANIKPIIPALLGILMLMPATIPSAQASPKENSNALPGSYRTELALGGGYMWGNLKRSHDEFNGMPAFVRLGFNMNPLFDIEGKSSSLQFTVEPFVNTTIDPKSGVESGCGLGLRYLHTLSGPIELYAEASAAPMYLSIDTAEQGHSGFNFLLQTGMGLQYRLSADKGIFAGYRFRHLSHGHIADRPNVGIESSAIIAGLAWYY